MSKVSLAKLRSLPSHNAADLSLVKRSIAPCSHLNDELSNGKIEQKISARREINCPSKEINCPPHPLLFTTFQLPPATSAARFSPSVRPALLAFLSKQLEKEER
jgi:hypothetical protein